MLVVGRSQSWLAFFIFLRVLHSTLGDCEEAEEADPVSVFIVNESGSDLFAQWIEPEYGYAMELNEPDDPCSNNAVTKYNAYEDTQLIFYEAYHCQDPNNCREISLNVPQYDEKLNEDDGEVREGKIIFLLQFLRK